MTRIQSALATLLGVGCLAGLALPVSSMGSPVLDAPAVALFAVCGAASLVRFRIALPFWIDGLISVLGAVTLLAALPEIERAGIGYWMLLLAAWASAWWKPWCCWPRRWGRRNRSYRTWFWHPCQ